jgi:excinuclease ABC subunit A
VQQISQNGSGGLSHAGPQPLDIVAAPDRARTAKGKFIVPEKKTGMPTARSAKPDGKPARKSAAVKSAKKSASIKKKEPA